MYHEGAEEAMMHTQEKQYHSERVELKGILSEFREALEEEIDTIKKSGQSSTLLYAGRKIESPNPDLWYQFNVEYIPSLPGDTPCKLSIGKEQFDVTVIGLKENILTVAAKIPLPDTISKAYLENGTTVLMERLIKCIENNANIKNIVGNRMLPFKDGVYPFCSIFTYDDLELKDTNTLSQNNAIKSALSNDITYIWGPPGTGKTTVIGQIIYELYKHGRSVLVVSHTNMAVDGAIEKAYKAYSDAYVDTNDARCPILRMGDSVRSLPDKVSWEAHVSTLGKELLRRKSFLEKRQEKIQNRINEILPQLAKSTWIKENRLQQIGKILENNIGCAANLSKIRHEIDEINIAIQQEKKGHPEYANYLTLSKTIKFKRKEYDVVCEQIHKTEMTIDELPLQIQYAQDESKKHEVYIELRAQEARFMSVPFLQNELYKINTRIVDLDNEISTLMETQTEAQKVVADYEKKNRFAKIFSGKSVVVQAQDTLKKIKLRFSEAKEELRRLQNLKQEYNLQIEKLLLLQEQIKAVIPSNTQEYWEKELKRLRSDFETAKTALSSLDAQRILLYEELCDLEQQQSQAKVPFDTLNEYSRRLRKKQECLEKAKALYTKENEKCYEYLKRESSFCARFGYSLVFNENMSLFDELCGILAAVKLEMASVDIEALGKEKEELDNQLRDIFRQIDVLKKKMQEIEKQVIMNAKIIGTTLAKSYLSDTLRERKFDTVILDEASMASIPALWCASYLAENSIVIVGDFLQLPPIVMAETPMAKKWLGKDIFAYSGMQQKAQDKDSCPDNFVMLNEQFRMESDIADVANIYYGRYGGLYSHDKTESRIKEREDFYKWYSGTETRHNIHLIDTESLHAWVTGVPQGKGHSRLNCFSAVVDVELAFKFIESRLNSLDPKTKEKAQEALVLIIAPYKPQVAQINQLIKTEYMNRGFGENLEHIKAGTIHSFQGSEADIVIFDLVIDEPHWKANLFMRNEEVNEDLRKMFNVAITRARFKLFIVGNFAYCQKRAKNNALSELLDKLLIKERLTKIDAKKFLPDITFSKKTEFTFDEKPASKHIVCREETFNDYFMADIQSFEKRLIIYSPFMTESRLSVLLPAFVDAVQSGKQIIVVTKVLSERKKTELAQYEKCETELRDIGVSILHKKGMHEKLIFIDSKAVWIGSLNALSFTGLTGEIMQRHADDKLTKEYEKLFDITHLSEAIENPYEQKCPICGEEMLIKESDEGGIYWQCVKGDYSRNVAQQYPSDGILRCKCGAPYVFSMKNEPRWVCSENPKHYQKVRESDLKLEKMVALIPTKIARKEVEKYFAQKRKEREKNKIGPKNKETVITVVEVNDIEQLTLF